MVLYKIVVLGDGGVGKSALTIQLTQNYFITDYDPTIENTYRKQATIDGVACVMDLLDTAGQEEYATMKEQYIRVGQGFIIMYSITNRDSFDSLPKLYQLILRVKDEEHHFPAVVIGNKCDLEKERQVSTSEGKQYADANGLPFYETSAKTKINVEDGFYECVREIKKWNERKEKNSKQPKPVKKETGCILI